MAEHDKWDDIFTRIAVPEQFDETKSRINSFIDSHKALGKDVVLVTSGGTTVPLESRTVRFIDNFSVGTRGSSSAEYFLQHGYAVLFLHRSRSLKPFSRHFSRLSVLDLIEISCTHADLETLTVKDCYRAKIKKQLSLYESVRQSGSLLCVEFTSLADYLYLLRASCQALHSIGPKAVLYLAAAVSDFYIPKNEMPEHKIQSSDGALQLSLQLVPKMLKPLVKDWVPSAFVVSFKLETDEQILVKKSKDSLTKYQHQLVIANVLDTRKQKVLFVSRLSEEFVSISSEEMAAGIEIESKIIPAVKQRHHEFLNQRQS
ncbi:phosphopantothenate--cysteine ligase-like [Liolophura sinensis]|uniref:phosphopantothenate--cysteine ligase-like n=1 Tax=Liolophura sinensis TaxID=3198878 RepID=UPI003158532C